MVIISLAVEIMDTLDPLNKIILLLERDTIIV